ncbi:MAG TPA: nucleotidyltransferase family protein [Allosphingosinicella sp.]|nr:nucleotidyltransferase family protein [Allosphingosinicella sp.]
MDRDAVVERLRAHEPELRRLGVTRLSLFGSVARGEAGPDSDIDLAAELERPMGLFRYSALVDDIEDMLGTRIDLVREPAQRSSIQLAIERDRVNVF